MPHTHTHTHTRDTHSHTSSKEIKLFSDSMRSKSILIKNDHFPKAIIGRNMTCQK